MENHFHDSHYHNHRYYTRSNNVLRNRKFCEICQDDYAQITEEHSSRYHKTCPYCTQEMKKSEYEQHIYHYHPFRLEIIYSGYAENLSVAYKVSKKDDEVICEMTKNKGGNIFTCHIFFPSPIEKLLFYFLIDHQKFRVANNYEIIDGKPKLNRVVYAKGNTENDIKLFCSGYTFNHRIGHTLSQYSDEIGEAGRSACTPICCAAVKYLTSDKDKMPDRDSIELIIHQGVQYSQMIHNNIETFNSLSRIEKVNVNEHLQTAHVIRFCHEIFNTMVTPGFKQGVISMGDQFDYVKDLLAVKDYFKDTVGAILTTKNVSTALVVRKGGQLILFDPHSFDYGDGGEDGASFLLFTDIKDLQEYLMERYPPMLEPGLEMFNTYEVNILIPCSIVKDNMKKRLEHFLQKQGWVQDAIKPFIEEEFRKEMEEQEKFYDAHEGHRTSNTGTNDIRSSHDVNTKTVDIYEELASSFRSFDETNTRTRESIVELANFLNNNANNKDVLSAKLFMLDYLYNRLNVHFNELCKNIAFRNATGIIDRIKMIRCFVDIQMVKLTEFYELTDGSPCEYIVKVLNCIQELNTLTNDMLVIFEKHSYTKIENPTNVSTSQDIVKLKKQNEGNWAGPIGNWVGKIFNINGNNKGQNESEMSKYPVPKYNSEKDLDNITREYHGQSGITDRKASTSMDLDRAFPQQQQQQYQQQPINLMDKPSFPKEEAHPMSTEGELINIDNSSHAIQSPQNAFKNSTGVNYPEVIFPTNKDGNLKEYDRRIQVVTPNMVQKKQNDQYPDVIIDFRSSESFMQGFAGIYELPFDIFSTKLPLLGCNHCQKLLCEPIKDNIMIHTPVHSPDCKELWYAFGCPYNERLLHYIIVGEQNLLQCKNCKNIVGIVGRLRKERDCIIDCRRCENYIYPKQNQPTTVINEKFVNLEKFQYIFLFYQQKVRGCFKRE